LVCNDSMSLHMASAFKIPTVVIFFSTSPEFGFGPWQNVNSRIVEDDTLECKPCRRHGSNQCPNNTETCMQISAEKVIKACKELL
ncbi:MAG: glycosyltransferase family 9 protein, partial [Desulfobacteraceae bacterium]|nr:glycosyltransferase family 9 protein [Desulfobacteraceae bacterium]